jgi:predicted enzyme related to lactoylglutathione lyase
MQGPAQPSQLERSETVDQDNLKVQSQITFLYYHDLVPASKFYRETMGFKLVEDQGWAKIYRVHGDSYLGIVDGKRGYRQPQKGSAVLITLAVNDVAGWYDYLRRKGVKMLTELREMEDIQVRGFFLEDPGGYAIEVQQFLNPEVARIFHQG